MCLKDVSGNKTFFHNLHEFTTVFTWVCGITSSHTACFSREDGNRGLTEVFGSSFLHLYIKEKQNPFYRNQESSA